MVLHPLVDCSLASLATTFRRDSRCTEDSVKERDKSLNGGIVGGGMKSQAMGAMNEVSVTRPDKRMAEGLGNGGTGGAAGDGALSLRRRQEEEIEGEGNREMLGDLEGKEGGGECVERWNGEASEPRERALGDAAVHERACAELCFVADPPHSPPPSQRTAPHPSVNTSTEYSLSRVTPLCYSEVLKRSGLSHVHALDRPSMHRSVSQSVSSRSHKVFPVAFCGICL